MKKSLRKFLCFMRLHSWLYITDFERKCKYCHRHEVMVEYDPGDGFGGPTEYWEDISTANDIKKK